MNQRTKNLIAQWFMFSLLVALLIFVIFNIVGCAQYEWVNPDGSRGKINTLMKDYDLKELTSTSQTLSADISVKPVPHIEVETKGDK